MKYLPLHVHSAFSFLYGSFSPQALVEEVHRRAGAGTGLCDKAGVYGMVRLARAGRSKKLFTLAGAWLQIGGEWGGGALILYPQDQEGHAQLCELVTRCHLANSRCSPRLDPAWLKSAGRRLVGILPGREALKQEVGWMAGIKALFPGKLFVGLPGREVDDAARDRLRQMAARAGLCALAAPEIVALSPRDLELHQQLVAIARRIHHRLVEPLPAGAGALPSGREMEALFSTSEIQATWQVARLCPFELPLHGRWLPDYPLPPGQSPQRVLAARCLTALARRGPVDKVYAQRLIKELQAIEGFGFAPYFLLVEEIVAFAQTRGIRTTVRGSAAGSMVTWLLCGGVDPVVHDLLFERFLNDGRHELPDVDLDFDSLRRNEVLEHVMARFPGQAAMVATVPTFRARSAVRELALARGCGLARASELTAFLPYYSKPGRLSHLLKTTPELADHPLNSEPGLVDLAGRIAGLPRQLSVHLGGVALGPLDRLTPLEKTAQGLKVIQLDKEDAEALGLIKLDLLGLRMHSAIAQAVQSLNDSGKAVDIDALPLDDARVYQLLCSTDTVGVFQVESPGQRGLLGRLQPQDFHDLMVEISLFRPGPMRADMMTPYLERRAGREAVTYPHPALEPILKETLGVVVFQEQVLKIAVEVAGLSWGQADTLRRAMTHRRTCDEMAAMRDEFLKSCLSRGVPEEVGALMWEQVASFASYGFPKAHAAAFAYITYQSAWLRAHHPLDFFLGLLNAGHVGSYPPRVLVNEARRKGIAILPPHVNHSGAGYRQEKGAIRVGLLPIRGMGPFGTAKIAAAREAGGEFCSLPNLILRTGLNRAQAAALARAGALKGLAEFPPGGAQLELPFAQ